MSYKINFKKILLLYILSTLMSGCHDYTDEEILCENPITTTGDMKIVDRECIKVGETEVGLLELENPVTHQHFFYTMNVVDDELVLNLTTREAIAIKNSDDYKAAASAAYGMSMSMTMMNQAMQNSRR